MSSGAEGGHAKSTRRLVRSVKADFFCSGSIAWRILLKCLGTTKKVGEARGRGIYTWTWSYYKREQDDIISDQLVSRALAESLMSHQQHLLSSLAIHTIKDMSLGRRGAQVWVKWSWLTNWCIYVLQAYILIGAPMGLEAMICFQTCSVWCFCTTLLLRG